MDTSITWVHLSDLHARVRDDWDSRSITTSLADDLRHLQNEQGLTPQLILFTGDAAFGAVPGESMANQYQLVRKVLDGVRTAVQPEIPVRHVFMTPGNHDIDRSEISAGELEWLRSSNRSVHEITSAIRDGKKQWRNWMDRFGAYRSFLHSYGLLHLAPDDSHLIWGDVLELAGVRVGIVGLNTAWSCADDQDKGRIWSGLEWQISQAKERVGPVDFSLALMHHPANWFHPHEDPRVGRHLRREFEIVLHGHEHADWVEVDDERHVVLSAGASYQSSWMQNGYSVCRLDLEARTLEVHLRQWDSSGGGWVARDVAKRTKGGKWLVSNLRWPRSQGAASETQDVGAVQIRAGKNSVEHFTGKFCANVVAQNDFLELFGCDIPRDLQRHQLSVAYVSLNLNSSEDVSRSEKGRPSFPVEVTEQVVVPSASDRPQATVASASFEALMDDISTDRGRLLILGSAGAGKSTLLRWCAVQAAQSCPAVPQAHGLSMWKGRSWRERVPILIRLRDCPEGKLPPVRDFPNLVAKHLQAAPQDWMTDICEEGRAIILLDGVDEVHRDKRAGLAAEIEELVRTYPTAMYVITSRPGAVEDDWLRTLEFRLAEVQPMGRRDREDFIGRWYQSAALELKRLRPGEDLARTAVSLVAELRDQPELGVLASNPLLCAMICALYRDRQEKLPETPAELCEALTHMLVHRRERETVGLGEHHFDSSWRALKYQQKKGLLADLAWLMMCEGESAIDVVRAERSLSVALTATPGRGEGDVQDVLQALLERSGVLRPAGDGRIDFVHNTLKEYLAAGRAVEIGDANFLSDRASDPSWQPVVLFALAIGHDELNSRICGNLLQQLDSLTAARKTKSRLTKRAQAAANALGFFLVRCRSVAKRLAPGISGEIDGLTVRFFPPAYMHDVDALAQLGPRLLVQTSSVLMDDRWWMRLDARAATRSLRVVRLIGGEKAREIVGCIGALPEGSSLLQAEWLLACADLEIETPRWPFGRHDEFAIDNPNVYSIEALRSAPSLSKIQLRRADIDDLSAIQGQRSLQYLDVQGSHLRSADQLGVFTDLTYLNISETNIADISALDKLGRLQHFLVSRVPITSISAVAAQSGLKWIDLSYTNVQDIGPLAMVKDLRHVRLSRTPVSSIESLAGHRSIHGLYADGTKIRDLRPVSQLSALDTLVVSETGCSDLTPVSGLKRLKSFYCEGTPVSDLSPLEGLRELATLHVGSANIQDMSVMRKLPALRALLLTGVRIPNLEGLGSLRNLSSLALHDASIGSLDGVENLKQLVVLTLRTEGVVRGLGLLKALKNLRHITLWTSSIVPRELAALAKTMPDLRCAMYEDYGAYRYGSLGELALRLSSAVA